MTEYIEGMEEFKVNMNRVDGHKVRETADKIGQIMQETAVMRVPVDTGNLRSSINVAIESDDDETSITVGTNIFYAPYVEYGTGQVGAESGGVEYPRNSDVTYSSERMGMEAQPFLRPALYDNEKRIMELVKDAVVKEMKGK